MIKSLITIFIAIGLSAGEITIKITNIKNDKGIVLIGLYNSINNFKIVGQAYNEVNIKPKKNIIEYTFNNIPNGLYAISIFHDENNNNILDKNFLGLPIEGYGFSNNIRPLLRGANFEESKFELVDNKTIIVKMDY